MFESVQIAIGIAAALGAFFLGLGLAIAGWILKAKRAVWFGVGFVSAGFTIVALVWLLAQQADRNLRFEAQAREAKAKDSPEVARLRWIEHADVIGDFRQCVEKEHDTRFVSVYGLGFGTEFPGLEDKPDIQQLVRQHGSRRLESGSDVFGSSLELELTRRISRYAQRYNSLLLGYLEHEK